VRGIRRHRALWLACTLTVGLVAGAAGGESVGAALSRAPVSRPAHRGARSPASEKPRVIVDAPDGPLLFELSPTDDRMTVRREAVRITITCSGAYRLLVKGARLRQDDGGHKASPEHLLIRRSGDDWEWARLSSEWVELADHHAGGRRGAKHVYTFDIGSDFGKGGSPWLLAGGDYLGGLEFKLCVEQPREVPLSPSVPETPHSPKVPPTPPDDSSPPSTPAAVPPAGTTETAPPSSSP
jgi:hypothetical protein